MQGIIVPKTPAELETWLAEFASKFDHTCLKPEATFEEIAQLCADARKYHFASVCVNSGDVAICYKLLEHTGVMVCSVVGFPLGRMSTSAKVGEVLDAINHGASEVDMVLNVGDLKSGYNDRVRQDIEQVVHACRSAAKVKVIMRTALLTTEEKMMACKLTMQAGAHFVKTCTGFGKGEATVEDITLMRKMVGPDFGVKASGGIRDFAAAMAMIQAGANRIGASAGVRIVSQAREAMMAT